MPHEPATPFPETQGLASPGVDDAVAQEPGRSARARRARPNSLAREYTEVLLTVTAVTALGHWSHLAYEALGHVYLLTVIVLSLRVGRWPMLAAAVVSAVAWIYYFMPPRLSFILMDVDDMLLLATYFVVALIGGLLTSRIREDERRERERQQHATALFHLTRALAPARTLDEGISAAVSQAAEIFGAQASILLVEDDGSLVAHAAGSLSLNAQEEQMARQALRSGEPAGRFTSVYRESGALFLALRRAEIMLGVLALRMPADVAELTEAERNLVDGFCAQTAMLVEREQLRAASERGKLAAESERLHRTLLDSVSHELKTPLAVLRSAGEHLDAKDAARRTAMIDEVNTATRRLDDLVSNLLNQSRIEAGRVRPQLDWCDARDIIRGARLAVGAAIDGHAVRVAVPDDMPLVRADATLIEQALANLLLNVAHHTPPGSRVTIAATCDEPGARVLFTVSDDGPGVPAELLTNLFQKFQRGPCARAGGLGLGLSIVRGFMEVQGGEVDLSQAPEGGARFTLSLPLIAPAEVPE